MKRFGLILFFLLTQLHVNAQFSASAGYRYSADGLDFNQNHINFYAHWEQPKHFHFSTGLEFTFKQLDFHGTVTDYDYSNGGPGYFTSYTHIYERTAKVNYVNLNLGLFFDWAIIDSPKFKLLVGFFSQLSATILEKEKDHQTDHTYNYSYNSPDENVYTSTKYPRLYGEFDAINMPVGNANIGLKLSPRKYFNQNYIQVDLSFGRTMRRVYKDQNSEGCFHPYADECFDYDFLNKFEKPFFVSFGVSLGHTF
jgi:hypothetical protein